MEENHLYNRAKELNEELKQTTGNKTNEEWTEEEVRKLRLGIRALGMYLRQKYPNEVTTNIMSLEEIESLAKKQGEKLKK
jgi:hypothetical protein